MSTETDYPFYTDKDEPGILDNNTYKLRRNIGNAGGGVGLTIGGVAVLIIAIIIMYAGHNTNGGARSVSSKIFGVIFILAAIAMIGLGAYGINTWKNSKCFVKLPQTGCPNDSTFTFTNVDFTDEDIKNNDDCMNEPVVLVDKCGFGPVTSIWGPSASQGTYKRVYPVLSTDTTQGTTTTTPGTTTTTQGTTTTTPGTTTTTPSTTTTNVGNGVTTTTAV